MAEERLTTDGDWDSTWAAAPLPVIYRKELSPCVGAIIQTLDRYLPRDPGLSVLEMGGAVGGYLAYMHRQFGYEICCLDYSCQGCARTRENFRLLGIEGAVVEGDVFSDVLAGRRFDIVYSLGLVEHFADLEAVVERHLAPLKPGGMLVIGVPSYLGINYRLARLLVPKRLSKHNVEAMDISTWNRLERQFKLISIFKGYIGGFSPGAFRPCERLGLAARLPGLLWHVIRRIPLLRRHDARWLSCYFMGIWKKP